MPVGVTPARYRSVFGLHACRTVTIPCREGGAPVSDPLEFIRLQILAVAIVLTESAWQYREFYHDWSAQ